MTDIVIAAAARTPVGTFNGGLSSVPAHYLGQVAITEAIKRAGIAVGDVSEVIMGQILAAGEGHSGRGHRLRRQPALRVGAADGCARLSGDPQRRFDDRRRRRT